jgi:hypothetical protein
MYVCTVGINHYAALSAGIPVIPAVESKKKGKKKKKRNYKAPPVSIGSKGLLDCWRCPQDDQAGLGKADSGGSAADKILPPGGPGWGRLGGWEHGVCSVELT